MLEGKSRPDWMICYVDVPSFQMFFYNIVRCNTLSTLPLHDHETLKMVMYECVFTFVTICRSYPMHSGKYEYWSLSPPNSTSYSRLHTLYQGLYVECMPIDLFKCILYHYRT